MQEEENEAPFSTHGTFVSTMAGFLRLARLLPCISVLLMGGCTQLGPDFVKPDAPVSEQWLANDESLAVAEDADYTDWWKVFNDADLDRLIAISQKQNLSLQIAALRILEARAQLGIAVGSRYPQSQQARGSITSTGLSENSPNFAPGADDSFTGYQVGFDAAWELDFWGKFQRGIESADADLNATIADYKDAMVSLNAEVARAYVTIRTLEERIALAINNIELQRESLRIAEVRYKHGATSELDVQQAKTNLADTRARVPALRRSLRQARNGLAVLLGITPTQMPALLAAGGKIPVAPDSTIIGIPTDLLRRRPDVQRAEAIAASQSALIGVAKTDLYPRFSLLGSIGLQSSSTGSSNAGDLLNSDSLTFNTGPVFEWNILNYGRLKNRIRVQDARYQQAIVSYRNTVLRAYQEVEDALVGFLQSRKEAGFRNESSRAAQRSSEIAKIQYREGAIDFQRVIDSERALVAQQDQWTTSRGDVALNLIVMYKSLGGGWNSRQGSDYLSDKNRDAMIKRTDWGSLLPRDSKELQ